jgi:hypothetical protein
MRKLLPVALATLAVFGFVVAPASAGLFHHCCQKFSACGCQYNAFSPFCVSGVSTSKHCHKCCVPAESPCGNLGWGAGCADGFCGPAAMAGGDAATLGVLPAPLARGTAQNGQWVVPQAPTALPAVPGAVSQVPVPARMIQSFGLQPPISPPGVHGY